MEGSGVETVMRELAVNKNAGQRYVLFERPDEVEHISLEKLGYFKKVLGMSDYHESFKSWIRRPEPLLFGCLAKNFLIGWSMFERWEKTDADRTPIFVMRMIEVAAKQRRRKIGHHLMALIMDAASGHLVTRPLSQKSAAFFKKMGFIEPPPDFSIDLQDKYGYLLLPTVTKLRFVKNNSPESLVKNSQNIKQCSDGLKTEVLRQEIARSSGFAHAFTRVLAKQADTEFGLGSLSVENKRSIKKDTARVSCVCGSFNIEFFSVTNGDQNYISVECQHCGKIWLTVPI